MTSTTESFLKNFALLEQSLNGESELPLHLVRRRSLERFTALGFPTTRDEDWRFTNITPLTSTHFRPVLMPEPHGIAASDVATAGYAGEAAHRLVFINGHFAPELSQLGEVGKGVAVRNLAAAVKTAPQEIELLIESLPVAKPDPFAALNTAFLRDGAFIRVPNGAIIEQPIHLLFIGIAPAEATVSHLRNLIAVGENAQATIIEEYASIGSGHPTFTNPVTQIVAGQNAIVNHYRIQHEQESGFHVGTLHAELAQSSTVNSITFTLGSAIVRNNTSALLAGTGAHCTMDGIYLANGTQLVDNHTTLDHAAPNCTSHELYKGVLNDRGRGVFSGRIIVRQDAQKTDSKQSNRNLLLSDTAVIDSKPQLEIFADDVKCTHGATIGQLSDDSLFYLRARGIGLAEARAILTYAFAEEVVEHIAIPELRDYLETLLNTRLEH
ncbi:MAG: Fe-S cluster assembly protein SufD [Chlorobi bacterium]|nr:Fe-S cluster assembly protein SufD [Chlorobiota bacterium]MBX7216576.1 Fe-S cluster assembly protein SufD [Candidatus Kapabacteria bacterium]